MGRYGLAHRWWDRCKDRFRLGTFGGTAVVLVQGVIVRAWLVVLSATRRIEACRGLTGWYVEINHGRLMQGVLRLVQASCVGGRVLVIGRHLFGECCKCGEGSGQGVWIDPRVRDNEGSEGQAGNK